MNSYLGWCKFEQSTKWANYDNSFTHQTTGIPSLPLVFGVRRAISTSLVSSISIPSRITFSFTARSKEKWKSPTKCHLPEKFSWFFLPSFPSQTQKWFIKKTENFVDGVKLCCKSFSRLIVIIIWRSLCFMRLRDSS